MNGIDHFDVDFPVDPSGIDHFDVEQPDQTPIQINVEEPPQQVTVKPLGTDVIIQAFVIEGIGPPGPQGIQGIPGPPGQGYFVVGELPGGPLNGTNTTFTTLVAFMGNSIAVFLNGLRLQQLLDYVIISGNAGFQMNYPPLSGDTLMVDYLVHG